MYKTRFQKELVALLAAIGFASSPYAAIVLPPSAKAPESAVDLTKPGFLLRMSQHSAVRAGFGDANMLPAVNAQLEGRIVDGEVPRENIIDYTAEGFDPVTGEGPFTMPFIFREPGTINYSQEATGGATGNIGRFTPDKPIPGVNTGAGSASTDHIAMEALGYIRLDPGTYTFAVNSDDGFQHTFGTGTTFRDFFALEAGLFNAGRGTAETAYDVTVEEAGYYPMRLLWWEGDGGANVEFYTIKNNLRTLVNDPAEADSVKVFQPKSLVGAASVVSVSPSPGTIGTSVRPNIVVTLRNDGTTVTGSSIQMTLNGTAVTPTVTTANGVTTVSFLPPTALAAGSQNTVVFSFTDSANNTRSNSFTFTAGNPIAVDAAFAVPASAVDTTKPGFNVYVHQAAGVAGTLENSTARVEAQLRGYLIDPATGAPYENLADPATSVDEDVINWNQHGDDPANLAGNFSGATQPDEPIPGIAIGDQNNIAAEITTYLQLPAGVTRLGVNSDDGFRLTTGLNPLALNATQLGIYEGGRGSSDSLFEINVPTAGFYPVRLVWYEGNGGANLEFFSMTPEGERILINDLDNPRAIKAYRSATVNQIPIVQQASPTLTRAEDASIQIQLKDQTTAVNQSSIALTLNGQTITPTITKAGDVTTISYSIPGRLEVGSRNTVALSFRDNANPANTITHTYTFDVSGEIIRRIFTEITGGSVNDLINNVKYISNTPDQVDFMTMYDSPDLGISFYGGEFLGYIVPPETGDYIFYLAADDNAQLWLSTDENPANKQLIATEPAWNGYRQFIGGDNGASRGNPPANVSAPIRLEAGKKYFTQGLWKEGEGGDHYSVAWKTPSGPAVVNGAANVISGAALRPIDTVLFTTQPLSQTVNKGLPVTFTTAYLSGFGNAEVQWLRNGQAIPDATGLSYTIDATQYPADNNARFSVRITDESGTYTSQVATLTVVDDNTAPTIASAYGYNLNEIIVQLDEPITAETAVLGNFTANGGLTVSEVHQINGNTVKLVLSGNMTLGSTYTVNSTGLSDVVGNTGNSTKTFTLGLSPGFVRDEIYGTPANPISGGSVNDLRAATDRFPHRPDDIFYFSAWEGPVNFRDNYGSRMSGWFIPPTNGDYVFFISSDDNGELWLSTDESPANLSQIAREPSWNGFREWVQGSNQATRIVEGEPGPVNISAPITLEAGKRYYMEALQKEGGGGDNLAVTFKMASEANPGPGTPSRLRGSLIATIVDPTGRAVNITTQPGDVSAAVGATATFNVAATVTPEGAPVAYQYQISTDNGATWTDISGANSANYTTPALTATSGAQYRVVVSTLGGVQTISNVARLSVGGSVNPANLSISRDGNNITITYTNGGRLQSAPEVTGPWTDVGDNDGSYTTTATGAARFFRVVNP